MAQKRDRETKISAFEHPKSMKTAMLQQNTGIFTHKATMDSMNANLSVVTELKRYDVLCGKGKMCQNHDGSRRFRLMITSYQQTYQKATTKQQRMDITKEIFLIFKESGSRFLKYNEVGGHWEEISALAARDKISHALRGTKPKNTAKKNMKHHRRNNSDSSASTPITLDEHSFEETPAATITVSPEHSFIDDLINQYHDDDIHPLQWTDDEAKDLHEPLPLDVNVDLLFLLEETHIEWDFEGDNEALCNGL